MPDSNTAPVITVDGPSGVGKGTLCLKLAANLGWHLLDSGALYRLVAFSAEQKNIALDDEQGLANLAASLPVRFVTANDEVEVLLSNQNVSKDIRTETCGKSASIISPLPAVRAALLDWQRACQKSPGLVADGRDMGTVVFPDAELKLFLQASAEERAKRRFSQLQQKGINVNLSSLLEDIKARDERDQNRSVAPLKPASDAHIIDTTHLSIEQVYQQALELAQQL